VFDEVEVHVCFVHASSMLTLIGDVILVMEGGIYRTGVDATSVPNV
jgi:hypothetical protein